MVGDGAGCVVNWRADAACRDAEPELFFVDAEGGDSLTRLRMVARLHCAACPVLLSCALYADDRRESGLWGGSYRSRSTGPYGRNPLIPGAPLHPLQPKVAEAAVGSWVA